MIDSTRRAEIARRNGALSKGPTSTAGKARSSQNAISHGLTANKTVVLQNENPETWERVLAAHLERYKPVDPIEHELVEDIAFCRWRLRRFRGVDTALWDLQMEQQTSELESSCETLDESARMAYAFRADANIQLASRYEGRLRRAYERAVRNFKEYRSKESVHTERRQNEPTLRDGTLS